MVPVRSGEILLMVVNDSEVRNYSDLVQNPDEASIQGESCSRTRCVSIIPDGDILLVGEDGKFHILTLFPSHEMIARKVMPDTNFP
jgi:hypothetical protein